MCLHACTLCTKNYIYTVHGALCVCVCISVHGVVCMYSICIACIAYPWCGMHVQYMYSCIAYPWCGMHVQYMYSCIAYPWCACVTVHVLLIHGVVCYSTCRLLNDVQYYSSWLGHTASHMIHCVFVVVLDKGVYPLVWSCVCVCVCVCVCACVCTCVLCVCRFLCEHNINSTRCGSHHAVQ